MRSYLKYILCLLVIQVGSSQVELPLDSLNKIFRFDEYLGYVKRFHPVVKQAQLVIDESQANLMRSRGAFDPKIEVDYDRKKFKNTEYYDKLNATFKIPTWYGIELKGNFEDNRGDFLNPENDTSAEGLYSAGVSFSLAQGLLINKRMAQLKQAKLFREQAKADRDLLVNNILYEASLAYFKWLQAYKENQLFQRFLVNAEQRFQGIKRGAETGQFAAIDSVEARIAVNDRVLKAEQTRIKFVKASFELTNYLWFDGNIPIELQPGVIPDLETETVVDDTFNLSSFEPDSLLLDAHPKLLSLDYKLQNLQVDRQLKSNMLLPRIDLEYNFLNERNNSIDAFTTSNYKAAVNFSFPLFLRKERGELNLAKLKIRDAEFEIDATRITLGNKIEAIRQELASFIVQNDVTEQMVSDYERMLRAEIRKFDIGESSLFLVNSRESSLINSQLKAIELQNKYFSTKAKLFNSLALNPDFLY
ncbi:TolC family protein [Winogradskyella aurantiaca]|uniref:TolC family protein n=1 Tax=Winogradskyella aurantiaca TaxID=2219558 RepID=UPI000E1DCFF4|nr:TolC family protein [Winogradskyella aurantiaca]